MFASLNSSRILCHRASSTASISALYPRPSSRDLRPIEASIRDSANPQTDFRRRRLSRNARLVTGHRPFRSDLIENAVHDPRSHQDLLVGYGRWFVLDDGLVEQLN